MMDKPLNEIMEFDHVVQVHADGTISDSGIYAPELYMEVDSDGQSPHADDSDIIGQAKSAGWELLSGFTGQYGYNGPVLHPSEFIGGGLERHIRSHPGYYVALTVECYGPHVWDTEPDGTVWCPKCGDTQHTEESDTCPGQEPAGWAVAYKPLEGSE